MLFDTCLPCWRQRDRRGRVAADTDRDSVSEHSRCGGATSKLLIPRRRPTSPDAHMAADASAFSPRQSLRLPPARGTVREHGIQEEHGSEFDAIVLHSLYTDESAHGITVADLELKRLLRCVTDRSPFTTVRKCCELNAAGSMLP